MICVVIDAAVGAADAVMDVIVVMAVIGVVDAGAADAAGAGAPTRMTGIITGGRYGIRAQARDARLSAPALTMGTG